MAFDAFIKIEGIPGDSLDEQHKDWIEIGGYSFGATQTISSSRSSGWSALGGASLQDFTFTKRLDIASSKLFEASCKGMRLKDVTLSLNRASGDKQRCFEIKLEEVLISNYVHSGDNGAPQEIVRLNFGRIKTTYTHRNPVNDQVAGKVCGGWDRIACKPHA